MRAALNTKAQNKAVSTSLSAPTGGWNTRDTLDEMPSTDATVLDNWFPSTGEVTLRKGHLAHQTVSANNPVDTLVEYHSGTVRRLIAAANGNIWNATSGPVSLKAGFTNNRWQTVNFSGRLFMVNGADAPQDYDGTTVTATAWSGTGLTIANLIGVNVFKNRLFFVEEDSQDFWYAGIDAVTGTLTRFPLSRVGQFGGKLMLMGTWSLDGGDGIDDYAVFIMTSGEVIVYQGTDPGVAANWSLVGVYRISPPVSRRGIVEVGGDLLIITQDDYVSLSQVLQSGQVGVASKLSGAVKELSPEFATFGWQAVLYRSGSMLIYNHPDGGNFNQHVVNTLTGAACRFTGMNAKCWAVFDNELYFGADDGIVYQADRGHIDQTVPIDGDGTQAWVDFGSPDRKLMKAVRVPLKSQGAVDYGVNLGFDFKAPLAPIAAAANSSDASLWDVALWDVGLWESGSVISNRWRVRGGSGQNMAVRVKVSGRQGISWLRTDFRLELGANL